MLAIGIAKERNATTRLETSSRVGQHACYWNRYGTLCSHPAQGLTGA